MFQLKDNGDDRDNSDDGGDWEPSASDPEEFEEQQRNNSYLENA